jgi:hypothetical protein
VRASTAVSGLVALAIGVPISQLPEFTQQYFQRLGGAVDELRIIVNDFDTDAARSNLDRSSALRMMAEDPKQFFRDQATRTNNKIARLSRLQDQQVALGQGGLFNRLSAFARCYDSPLAQRTWENYRGALSLDGVLLGGFASVVSFLVMIIVCSLFSSERQRHA